MSSLGIAVVLLTKAVASFVMATSVGVAGIGDALPAKKQIHFRSMNALQ